MKHLIIALLFVPLISLAQESEISKQVASKFEEAYNAQKPSDAFEIYDTGMKKAVSLEKTQAIFSGLMMQLGKITERKFLNYEGPTAKYEATFERGKMLLLIASNDDGQIIGLLFKPWERQAKFERNSTKLILPFNEEWDVFWGGDTRSQNYHVDYPNQKGAFDLVIFNERGKSYKSDGKTNDDYYVFGKDLIAPCDATVVEIIDGIADNVPGVLNPEIATGNTVVLKTEKDEFIFLAHFKQNSIVVEEGQEVNQGDLLGKCGNSGNSSEPHLHLHIQDEKNFFSGIGAKCYFEEIIVNGEVKQDYSPVQGDKIKNTK